MATAGSSDMSPMGGERYTTDQVRNGADSSEARTGIVDDVLIAASESELAGRFWERIRLFAARRLRDSAAAEDVAQETLRCVLDALRARRIENLEALPGFVFQTARHICLQRDRSATREARAFSRISGTDVATEPSALAMLISEERCAAVRRALDALEHDDRALLRALYFESGDTADIARRMGLTAGALRVRKHRALQRLSELLLSRDQ